MVRFGILLTLFFLPAHIVQAQQDDRAGAPGKLSVETTENGLVLSWDAPASEPDKITGYEISGLHVQRGIGIVEELTGLTDEKTTSWTDETATDPDLLYVYRVRALLGGAAGRWSSFVITEIAPDLPEDLAEPTAQPDVAAPEPTTSGPEAEPTALAPVNPALPPEGITPDAPAPGITPGAQEAEAREEEPAPPDTSAPEVPVEPTSRPEAPAPEPTAAMPEPEPTAVPPAAPVAPPAEEEEEPAPPDTSAPEVPVEPTSRPEAPAPEPTASRPEPEPTQSA